MHVVTCAWLFQVYLVDSASRSSAVLFFQVLRAFNLVLKFAQVLFFSRQILLLYSSISANYDHSHPCHTSHAPWEPCLLSLTQSVT